jgi:hypothetical protein
VSPVVGLALLLLPCSAFHVRVPLLLLRGAPPRIDAYMQEAPDVLKTPVKVTLDEAVVEAAAEAAATVIEVEPAEELQLDRYNDGVVGHRDAVAQYRDVGNRDAAVTQYRDVGHRDAAVTQYREAASFFGDLLKERATSSRSAGASTPLKTTVQERIQKMHFLQSELEYVITSGLASTARKQWLVDKAALEGRKRECQQDWAELRSRQETVTEAWQQLGTTPSETDHAAQGSSALTLTSQWTPGAILSRTSLKEQIALIEEHVCLAKRQVEIDAEDEVLMKTALELYEQERPSRDRRAEILAEQQLLLTELQHLAEDTRAFNGHSTFVSGGFAEGLTY